MYEIVCTSCGKELMTMDDVAYMGPIRDGRPDEENMDCNPFMDFGNFCEECYAKFAAPPLRAG
jgi:hypothetical protein